LGVSWSGAALAFIRSSSTLKSPISLVASSNCLVSSLCSLFSHLFVSQNVILLKSFISFCPTYSPRLAGGLTIRLALIKYRRYGGGLGLLFSRVKGDWEDLSDP